MNAPFRLKTFTNAEFERIARAGGFKDARVELRRGMIAAMSPQYYPHAHVKTELTFALAKAVLRSNLTLRVTGEVSVAFARDFQPLPDIVVWNPAEAPANLDGPIPASAVKLIVEVADTTLADDLGDKLSEYAAGGLTEYWVADVKARIVLRHADIKGEAYARREPAHLGEHIASLTIPSLNADTSSLR